MPVIRNVEEMDYADIEKAINTLGEKVYKQCFNQPRLRNRFF